MRWVANATPPDRFTPQERSSSHLYRRPGGPQGRSGKSYLHRDSIPGSSSPQRVLRKAHVAQTKLPDRCIRGDRLSKIKCMGCFIVAGPISPGQTLQPKLCVVHRVSVTFKSRWRVLDKPIAVIINFKPSNKFNGPLGKTPYISEVTRKLIKKFNNEWLKYELFNVLT
jgi:hypothetical protein